jgi:Zn-dependent protease
MVDFSPNIGKIDDIPIQLHWTFIMLLVFILILSLYLFVVWILLFVCVLIHELFHSITSKRNGIKVNKIILYPFGGGSIIDFDKVSPEIEFRISIVGPIASLFLAAIFGIVNIYTPAGIIGTTIQILFVLNIFLGVFNLLPWLPLDGGRALRSYLQKSRSFLDATRVAVKSSNVVTVLFVAGTVVFAALVHGYSTLYREFIVLWDVAIAFFIYSGAQAEMQSAIIRENVKDLKAQDAATQNYVLITGVPTVKKIYNAMMKNGAQIILFKKGDEVRILSSQSLQKLMKGTIANYNVESFSVPIPSVAYNTRLYSAIEQMRSGESNIAALVKGKKIEGVLLMQHIESIIALHISQKNSANIVGKK